MQIVRHMESSSVDDEQNHLLSVGIDACNKLPQCNAHDGGIHSWQQEPEIFSRCRMNECVGVQPLVVRVARSSRTRPTDCPDSAHRRLQTKTRFVLKPQLNVFVGMKNDEYGSRDSEYFFSRSSAPVLSHSHCALVWEPAT